jgi:hypothetical protein
MLKPISNPNSLLACCADCPADNHARQLALFLYETLAIIPEHSKNLGKIETNRSLKNEKPIGIQI